MNEPHSTLSSSSNLGENLIFLLSLPRSGSTLLQRILAGNPAIQTLDEPWLMLKPLYGLKHEEVFDTHIAKLAQKSVKNFLESLTGGEEDYFEAVRRMYGYLYERALAGSGKRYFLDKTPPYFYVIPELVRTFPNAKYIFLLRNPLGVLAGIHNFWIVRDWLALYGNKNDLLVGPTALLAGIEVLRGRGLVVHYENIVRNPEIEIKKVCEWLGINFNPEMVNYGTLALPEWKIGDQKLYAHSRPHTNSVDGWRTNLMDPQFWRVASDYLKVLGPETVTKLGYTYPELTQAVKAAQPSAVQMRFTWSLEWLLDKPREERPIWQQLGVRTISSLRARGPLATMALAAQRAKPSFLKSSDSLSAPVS